VEEGSHAELIARGGLYQRLYEEQTSAAGRGSADLRCLRSVPLLASLDCEALTALAGHVTLEHFGEAQDVVHQGDAGDKLYIVRKGRLEVLVQHDSGERRVNSLGIGEFFGEIALLTGEARTATVRTMMPTELYSLAQRDFACLVERNASIANAVRGMIATRREALATASAGT
jgi:ATP-binding cassette subfamily B protein